MLGLPSVWGRYTLIGAWSLLALVVMFPVLVRLWSRLSFPRRRESRVEDGFRVRHGMTRKPRFSLFTRSICLMLAFLFIVGPNEFQTLAHADIIYDNLTRATWSQVNDTDTLITITYKYDNNGSLVRKVTWDGDGVAETGSKTKALRYEYNLQNRLAAIYQDTNYTPLNPADDTLLTAYRYNNAGIRVSKTEYSGGSPTKTILYLIDSFNHTGYAQPIAELTYLNTATPDPATAADSVRSYVIGDDVLAQNNDPLNNAAPDYLLYDGHGSTRQLVNSSGTVNASYSYDAYGVMLGGNPSSPAATNLLYSGEQFDTNAQQYYLRARYYDQNNGRFNRVDPFSGNNSDPQSLHKYLYCHANPVNAIDPSGMMSKEEALSVSFIQLSLVSIVLLGMTYTAVMNPGFDSLFDGFVSQADSMVRSMQMSLINALEWLKAKCKSIRGFFRNREGIYLHYSFRSHMFSLVGLGLWDISDTYCTRFPYPIGWLAKLFLAIYKHKDPPNAIYIVWPRKGFGPSIKQRAKSRLDPYWKFTLPGGGTEYKFIKGSGGPGTVFGPIRIPPGSLDDVRRFI